MKQSILLNVDAYKVSMHLIQLEFTAILNQEVGYMIKQYSLAYRRSSKNIYQNQYYQMISTLLMNSTKQVVNSLIERVGNTFQITMLVIYQFASSQLLKERWSLLIMYWLLLKTQTLSVFGLPHGQKPHYLEPYGIQQQWQHRDFILRKSSKNILFIPPIILTLFLIHCMILVVVGCHQMSQL